MRVQIERREVIRRGESALTVRVQEQDNEWAWHVLLEKSGCVVGEYGNLAKNRKEAVELADLFLAIAIDTIKAFDTMRPGEKEG